MHRLFFALWPDEAVRREIADAAREQQGLDPAGRAVRPERYHLTLQFLGDFDVLTAAMHGSLLAAAGAIDAPAPFELRLDRVGSFGAGRVVWLGCSEPPAPLVQLHRDLAGALAKVGITPGAAQQFIPHVTLHRNMGRSIGYPTPALRWRVAEFVLIDAIDGDYRCLGRWPSSPD
jgi:RNA 2',3'-cyclic 3'-phosphodiesterase